MSRQDSAHKPDVGAQIRKARDAAGISQVELAKRLGCGERSLQSWERNERSPRLDALTAIALELGQSVAYFYGAEDPTSEPNGEGVAA